MVCYDLRPMNVLRGDGLASLLINFGKLYGIYGPIEKDDITDFLPSSATVKEKIKVAADCIRSELKVLLPDVFGPKGGGGTLSVDIWTDSYRAVSYLGAKVHYITDDFELITRVICNQAINENDSHNAFNIITQVRGVLDNYGIAEDSDKLMFMTDRGPNIKAAFGNHGFFDRMFCFIHFICGIIKEGLEKEDYKKQMITNCKSVVTYLKHGHKMPLFAPTLKNPAEPRWNSVITMLKSIKIQWETLHEVLGAIDNGLKKLDSISINYVSSLIEFLEPFENATMQLQCTETPTIQLLLLWDEMLQNHMAPNPTDCEFLKKVRSFCLDYHRRNHNDFSNIWIKVGFYLNPMTKGLRGLTEMEISLLESFVSIYLHFYFSS